MYCDGEEEERGGGVSPVVPNNRLFAVPFAAVGAVGDFEVGGD